MTFVDHVLSAIGKFVFMAAVLFVSGALGALAEMAFPSIDWNPPQYMAIGAALYHVFRTN